VIIDYISSKAHVVNSELKKCTVGHSIIWGFFGLHKRGGLGERKSPSEVQGRSPGR